MEEELTDEQALLNFLMDEDCLDELEKETSKVNVFEVLGAQRAELRHSNMIAWLIDPLGNHGFGSKILRSLFREVVERTDMADVDAFNVLLADFGDFEIRREWHNIDILALSNEGDKVALCIENKVGTGEHDDQLARYTKTMTALYPGYKVLYAYLTPDGAEASHPDWAALDYEAVIKVINAAKDSTSISPEVKMLLDHYEQTVRRYIMTDEELREVCNNIYRKHRRALDLIFENRPDYTSLLSEAAIAWCESKLEEGTVTYDRRSTTKTKVRFKTPEMEKMLPDLEGTDAWKAHAFWFYEISLSTNTSSGTVDASLQICCNNDKTDLPESRRGAFEKMLLEAYGVKPERKNWTYTSSRIGKKETFKVEMDGDKAVERLGEKLDKWLAEALKLEAKAIETLSGLEYE